AFDASILQLVQSEPPVKCATIFSVPTVSSRTVNTEVRCTPYERLHMFTGYQIAGMPRFKSRDFSLFAFSLNPRAAQPPTKVDVPIGVSLICMNFRRVLCSDRAEPTHATKDAGHVVPFPHPSCSRTVLCFHSARPAGGCG